MDQFVPFIYHCIFKCTVGGDSIAEIKQDDFCRPQS